MEDNITSQDTFAPSIFDTVNAMATESKLNLTPSATPKEDLKIDLDTAKILVTIPFDIAAQVLKSNDIYLNDKQVEKLGQLWRAPMERLLSKYEDSDLYIAAAATVAIAGEKYLDYKLEQSRRNRTGNEREGKDELRKESSISL